MKLLKVFGILEIGRKTDILAFVAFFQSIQSPCLPNSGFVRGPDVALIGPRQALLLHRVWMVM